MLRYSGVDTSSPIPTWSLSTGTSSSQTAPSVSASAEARVLRILAADDAFISSSPPSHDLRVSIVHLADEAPQQVLGTVQASTGATGTASWSTTALDPYVAATIVIAPDPPTTYYYRLQSVAGDWRSADSNTASG